jgi:Tfp pilus assembly protein PilF
MRRRRLRRRARAEQARPAEAARTGATLPLFEEEVDGEVETEEAGDVEALLQESLQEMTEDSVSPETEVTKAAETVLPREVIPDTVEREDMRLVRARDELAAGHVSAAVGLYREVLLDRPRDVAVRTALGHLYEMRGEPHLALEQFEAARDAAPDSIDVLVNHANALAAVGRFDPAERELRRALKMDPMRPEVHSSLGIINFRRGTYALAEQELKRAIELDPSAAAAYHYRGESLNQLGRVDEALSMLERAAQLQPVSARTYYVMGIVFDKKGRPQEAAAMYRKAREIAAA